MFDIRDDYCIEIRQEIESNGGKFYFFKCDITNEKELNNALEKSKDIADKLDIMINNVGIANLKYFSDTSIEEINTIMNVNFLSHALVLKKILPRMIKAKAGHIISISSVAYLVPGIKMY